MAPINETHSEVAGVTPHGQPRTLHGAADDGRRATGPEDRVKAELAAGKEPRHETSAAEPPSRRGEVNLTTAIPALL